VGEMRRRAMSPLATICCFAFSFAGPICAGQQPATPAAAPAANPPIVHSLEQGRADLRAAEAAHPGDSHEVAEALVSLIYDEIMVAVSAETLSLADRAIRTAEVADGKESSMYAVALAAKSRVLGLMDRPELARPLAEEALAIEQRVGGDPRRLSDVAAALGGICQRNGDKACALKTADVQVKALRGMKDVDPLDMATALDGLMYAHRMSGELAEAKLAADEEMGIAERAETVAPEWAILESNAGAFYMIDHECPLALTHLQRSLEMRTKLDGADSITLSAVVANLAYVEMCLGHTADALQYYARARDLNARRYGPAHSQTARVEAGYGYTLSLLGHSADAIAMEVSAHSMQREHIRLAIRLMPEQQALAMVNTGAESFNLAITLAIRHPEIGALPVYQEVVRSRALVAEEMAQRQAALNRKRDPAMQALEKELEQEAKQVMELQSAPSAGRTESALNDATAKMEKTQRDLAEQSAPYRADERAENSDLADLRKNMPPGSVVISYVSYAKYAEDVANFNKTPVLSYMAFVMHPNSERIAVYDLGDAKPIVDLVRRMRASVDAESRGGGLGSVRNEREYREAGLALRKLIWDPLQRDLAGVKLALVAPDGILHLVPFSTLPSGKGYLVQHGPVVHILTSERDLLPAASGAKKAGLLAIGSPLFELARSDTEPALAAGPAASPAPETERGGSIKCQAFTDMDFQSLPGSLSEVREISSTFKRWNAKEPEELLTGENATRTRFLDAATQARVLHIATHAFVLEKSCGNGNPLLHSGLVFAGANSSRNTSILTAEQIASLDLSGVDWAVLSACNTGNGELKDGEGVLGLQRSFRVAGAKSVVMALWPVDDEVTREFMRGLYSERFGRHATTADSVWLAARGLLLKRQAAGKSTQPWYWAGFVGAGAWE
jgi:CHAT domain-containing protein